MNCGWPTRLHWQIMLTTAHQPGFCQRSHDISPCLTTLCSSSTNFVRKEIIRLWILSYPLTILTNSTKTIRSSTQAIKHSIVQNFLLRMYSVHCRCHQMVHFLVAPKFEPCPPSTFSILGRWHMESLSQPGSKNNLKIYFKIQTHYNRLLSLLYFD